ncbi:methyltransferase domain-containing protein [Kitasatospora sp. NPDC002040]|uniref:class I SAM-dependent methyltransferase n=1 Tax=Kitasatospora sp. NPDC002040 TaxID=3154661 RepID=UPI00333425CD
MASAQVTGTTAERSRTPVCTGPHSRARDWAEIQERMLVPLYQAVYERLDVGPATSVLGLGCRSGLALLLAAERGAQVAGLESDTELRELAQGRRLQVQEESRTAESVARSAHSVVTVFEQLQTAPSPGRLVTAAARRVLTGGQLVLATWGPPERCESAAVLEVAQRRAGRTPGRDPFALGAPGRLEALLTTAGLRPAGGGRVSCPFAYADPESAVRGMLSTGLFDPAVAESGQALVVKELEEALHPFVRPDGSVRMANLFRYVVGERVN